MLNLSKIELYFLNKLVLKNGIKLKLDKTTYKRINDWYRDNLDLYSDIYLFINDFYKNFNINPNNFIKPIEYEFTKQFNKKQGLQAGIISECVFASTIAEIFELDEVFDCDIGQLPIYVNPTLQNIRYLYYKKSNINEYLCQLGSPDEPDLIYVRNDEICKIDIKENPAKLGELDITGKHDNSGKLIIDDDFRKKHNYAVKMIEEFNLYNNGTNTIFNWLGTNYKHFTTSTLLTAALGHNQIKNISFLISYDFQNNLIIIPLNLTSKIIDFSGSEIRIAGRNHGKVFSYNFLLKTINDLKGATINNIVNIPFNLNKQSIARGKKNISRYKLNEVFFLKIKDVVIQDNNLKFNIKDVRQLVPTVSPHINISLMHKDVYNILKSNIAGIL